MQNPPDPSLLASPAAPAPFANASATPIMIASSRKSKRLALLDGRNGSPRQSQNHRTAMSSPSPPWNGGEGRGEEARFCSEFPAPRPPHLFLMGRGRNHRVLRHSPPSRPRHLVGWESSRTVEKNPKPIFLPSLFRSSNSPAPLWVFPARAEKGATKPPNRAKNRHPPDPQAAGRFTPCPTCTLTASTAISPPSPHGSHPALLKPCPPLVVRAAS